MMNGPELFKVPHLSLRMHREKTLRLTRRSCFSSAHAAEVAKRLIGDMPEEHLIAIMLDGKSNITGVVTIAKGGMHGLAIRAADVIRNAIACHASAFVLAHNHPSGDTTPSPEDRAFTDRVKEAGDAVGLPLVDHVIVSRGEGFDTITYGTT